MIEAAEPYAFVLLIVGAGLLIIWRERGGKAVPYPRASKRLR